MRSQLQFSDWPNWAFSVKSWLLQDFTLHVLIMLKQPINSWWRHDISASHVLCEGNRPGTSGFPHEGLYVIQWFSMFYWMLAWTSCWTNSRVVGDLRRHVTHVIAILIYMSSYFVLDSSIAIKTGGCYPGDSLVRLADGRTSTMDQLSVGDQVLAMDTQGQLTYSDVILKMHTDTQTPVTYYTIHTDSGRTLTVTPGHLVYVSESNVTKAPDATPIFASRIAVGDFIFHGSDTSVTPLRVTKINAVVKRGAYAPLTAHGTIVVDDVITSCYAMIDNHALAHWALWPVRMYRHVQRFLWGMMSLDHRDCCDDVTSASHCACWEGVHWYISLLHDLGRVLISDTSWFTP